MNPLSSIAFIGNQLPRHCGIATFTHDLHQAVAALRPAMETGIVAMTDHGRSYDYPASVRYQIDDQAIENYAKAAEFLNDSHFDAVSLQHEFGIFGGEAGSHVMALLSRLRMPIVTTLHTVLSAPTSAQRDVVGRIADVSSKVVVMAEKGRELLIDDYSVPSAKIEVIPHGIPDVPFIETHYAKGRFGFADKTVILTFGLLSPNKGIEYMIDAMPAILAACPSAVYVVLGATHPNLVMREGEAYREKLQARARELGVDSRVVFFDRFVDQTQLLEFIAMCDIYVTPYLNEEQMTSGTLAYSFGSGKAVVSTPYWHAKELLADGRGVLVPFADSRAMATEITTLLTNDVLRHAMRKRAYAYSRPMTWRHTANRYLAVMDAARKSRRETPRREPTPDRITKASAPPPALDYLLSMCDGTGILQHAVYSVPDRDHGYCVDDNARALILSCALGRAAEAPLPDALSARLAAFLQHAWNPDTRRFRNFMSYGRAWLEDQGSEDSHGRTLWALGVCARDDTSVVRQRWARALFRAALPTVESFQSPRAWAFTLLGLDGICACGKADPQSDRMRTLLADRLLAGVAAVSTPDWVWFEDELSYDNARLCQALIVTGAATKSPDYLAAGLRTLRWLMGIQTTSGGFFRPVGTEGFGASRLMPKAFDQQPVDAAATISACIAAWNVSHAEEWRADAELAFRWFLGDNDLGVPLVDHETGACSDGLHSDRHNENSGAESVLSWLLSVAEMRQFVRIRARSQMVRPAEILARSA
jgi:glycosyltransferase involved in cell wall biosynthesis